MERKLTAILCADVHGYSRLMGQDDEATLQTLTSHRRLIDSSIERHRGRFVNSAGDSLLAEFGSVIDAVNCAVDVQTSLKAENTKLPPERRMEFRIGVNLGEVMVQGEQIYGDGVNVAARLESLADPGGICISGTVHEHIRDKLAVRYADLGDQQVKNIARPVRVYRLSEAGAAASKQTQRVARKYGPRSILWVASVASILLTILLMQHVSLRPPHSHASIPPLSPALALADKPSIAMLPFVNLSRDPEQEYFSDGITDDLITDLSRLPSLFVIARGSSFTYKSKAEPVQQIGRELGVKYLLEGSVRKAEDQVRIDVRLVDASGGNQVWGQRYDRQLRDIFKLQDELVRRIITTLGLQISLLQKGFVFPQHTTNLDAYDYYLRGAEQFVEATTRDDFAASAKMIEKAVALDPGYSDAYSGLGLIHLLRYGWYFDGDSRELDLAEELERRALTLNDSDVRAHTILGEIAENRGRLDDAIAYEKRAISLDPNDSDAYIALSDTLNTAGKPEEALIYAQKAMRLDPQRTQFYSQAAGFAYEQMGRLKEALDALRAGDLANPWVHLHLIYVYSELDREQDARSEAAELVRLAPGFSLERLWARNPGDWNTPSGRRHLQELQKAGLN